MGQVTDLFQGDPRCEQLLTALQQVLDERGTGLPIPAVLGTIDILKEVVMQDAGLR